MLTPQFLLAALLLWHPQEGQAPDSEPAKPETGRTAGGRPIVQQDGKTMVWARQGSGGAEDEFFDFTEAAIDPRKMDHGIGRDTISSIDSPAFVAHDDEQLAEAGIDRETWVIGVELNGVAKAYILDVMNRHEIVNDQFDGEPFAVLW